MDYYKIILPTGQNDYLCRTMLDGELCVLHLSYNSTGDFWTIGFCNDEGEPIVDGIRLVPNFPLNVWYTSYSVPQGALVVLSTEERITRYSFDDGSASLCYIPTGGVAGMKNFKRAYRLIAGTTGTMGFEIGAPDVVTGRSLHINFEVERGDSESNNTATIKIYNLSPQSLAVLEQENCVVDLQAGYDGDMATIIQGTVSHIDSAHEGADTCTKISIVDGLVATRDTNVSVSYRGSVNGKKILTDAAANMGCAILFSPSCTFPSFKNFSFVGSATTLFHQVCDASNTNFSIQNGVVQVCAANEAITAMAYVLSAETGLIGYPERLYDNASTSNSQNANTTKRKTQTGWKVTFLMNGHIQANDYVMLSSKLATGAFRVSKIDTKGDSEGSGEDSWVCVAELLEVK